MIQIEYPEPLYPLYTKIGKAHGSDLGQEKRVSGGENLPGEQYY